MNKRKIFHRVIMLAIFSQSIIGCLSQPVWHEPTPIPTPSIPQLIETFSSQDYRERAWAASIGVYYHDHPDKAILLPYLIQALSDPDSEVRAFAAQSIGDLNIYDEEALRIMISWLDGGMHSPNELIHAMQAIRQFAEYADSATPGLIHVLNTRVQHEQLEAIKALAAIGDTQAITPLLDFALSNDEETTWMRDEAVRALAVYGPVAGCTVPSLVPFLDSSEDDIRTWAAAAIHQASGQGFVSEEMDENLARIAIWEVGWRFQQDSEGSYLIVAAAKEWWQEAGRHTNWPPCS